MLNISCFFAILHNPNIIHMPICLESVLIVILQSIERKCWNSQWLWPWLDNINNQFCLLAFKGSFTEKRILWHSLPDPITDDIIISWMFSSVIEEMKIFLIPRPLFITICVEWMLFFNLDNSKSWHLKSTSNFFFCLLPKRKKKQYSKR